MWPGRGSRRPHICATYTDSAQVPENMCHLTHSIERNEMK